MGSYGISLSDYYNGTEPERDPQETTTQPTKPNSPTTDPTVPIDVDPESVVYGDADCDGLIKMNDAVLIMQALSNNDKYGESGSAPNHLSPQGAANADCFDPGTKLTPYDALAIQKFLLKKNDLPELSK